MTSSQGAAALAAGVAAVAVVVGVIAALEITTRDLRAAQAKAATLATATDHCVVTTVAQAPLPVERLDLRWIRNYCALKQP